MVKIHTRLKRKYNLSRSRSHKIRLKTSKRPKTFKTEEAAKTWAEANKITNYHLENLKSPTSRTKKIRIIKK